jgi:hypothetical protein
VWLAASAGWLVILVCVIRFQSTDWTIWRALGLLAFTLGVPVAVWCLGLFAVWVARGFRVEKSREMRAPELFAAVGRALYGDEFVAALAFELGSSTTLWAIGWPARRRCDPAYGSLLAAS